MNLNEKKSENEKCLGRKKKFSETNLKMEAFYELINKNGSEETYLAKKKTIIIL